MLTSFVALQVETRQVAIMVHGGSAQEFSAGQEQLLAATLFIFTTYLHEFRIAKQSHSR